MLVTKSACVLLLVFAGGGGDAFLTGKPQFAIHGNNRLCRAHRSAPSALAVASLPTPAGHSSPSSSRDEDEDDDDLSVELWESSMMEDDEDEDIEGDYRGESYPELFEEEDDGDDEVIDEDDVLLFSDLLDRRSRAEKEADQDTPWKENARWNSLHPRKKLKIIQEAQQRAIANKKKRESPATQKRRKMMMVKELQKKKKLSARVRRPTNFRNRTPLTDLSVGMERNGTVISLTRYGVYVDVGTECDGLLHISQMSDTKFIEHPREMFAPGDQVTVWVSQVSPEWKKMHLTMLPQQHKFAGTKQDDNELDDEDRLKLDEVAVDDELWGELKRVTEYGAYVDVGAVVDGFLHFMDHPEFSLNRGASPSTYMRTGTRVRVWVSDIDMERERIKLTANRPKDLPGPRRELAR